MASNDVSRWGLGRQFRPPLRKMGLSFRQTDGTEPNRSCCSEQLWRRRGVGRTGPYGQETRGVQRKPYWYGNSCRQQSCPFAHFDAPPRTWGIRYPVDKEGWQRAAHSRGAYSRPTDLRAAPRQAATEPIRTRNSFAPLSEVGREGDRGSPLRMPLNRSPGRNLGSE